MKGCTIRRYREDDANKVVSIFYDTVHNVCAADYTEEQLDAWAGRDTDVYGWNAVMANTYAFVAEMDGEVVGFANLDDRKFLDRLYVAKEYIGKGVGTMLEERIALLAYCLCYGHIYADVSVTALPFFKARGYRIVMRQTVIRKDVPLNNYLMLKIL